MKKSDKNSSKVAAPFQESEMVKQIARFELAEVIIERVDILLEAAPEIFEVDPRFDYGRRYVGDIIIARRSFMMIDGDVCLIYSIEADGITAFSAEASRNPEGETIVSSVFIIPGSWADKLEKLENSVREAHAGL